MRNGERFHQCFCGHASFISGSIKSFENRRMSVKRDAAEGLAGDSRGEAVKTSTAAVVSPTPSMPAKQVNHAVQRNQAAPRGATAHSGFIEGGAMMRFSASQHMKAADEMERLSEMATDPTRKKRRMELANTHRILARKADAQWQPLSDSGDRDGELDTTGFGRSKINAGGGNSQRDPEMSVHELMTLARKHWKTHLPDKVKELQAEGMLEAAINGAANLAQSEIETLMKAGYQEHEAREVALPFILLPPEYHEDEQDRELAEKERQYRMNPPVVMDADPNDE
jgi:hypothetical protein